MKVILENLTKRFPPRNKKGAEVIAVNNFNFEIPDGQLIGLLGPSGCGKSTTLNLISGLETPTEGKIWFGDEDVTNLPPEERGVGLVFQNYALYPHLTVEENIIFPLQNLKGAQKMSKEAMHQKAVETAKLVQIDGLMERKPKEMSGGQQQRVAIARALVKVPKVLLLDEPLSNLDARLRLQTREELRRIQRDTGVTTIFVTHDQEEAMSISDLIIVMKEGVLQQIGKPQDVAGRVRRTGEPVCGPVPRHAADQRVPRRSERRKTVYRGRGRAGRARAERYARLGRHPAGRLHSGSGRPLHLQNGSGGGHGPGRQRRFHPSADDGPLHPFHRIF